MSDEAKPASPGWACSQCANLQPASDRCARCGYDVLLDTAREGVRELLRENDERMKDKYRDRNRWIAVTGGVGLVIAAMFLPGYWKARGTVYPGLPFLADQILFMVLIALGLLKLLDARIPRTRYPWLDGLPPPTAR